MSAFIFDGAGHSLESGPPLDDLDLRRLPACRVVGAPLDWDGAVDVIVIFPGDDLTLSPHVLAHLVTARDRGAVFAVHAGDDDALIEVLSAVHEWVGGAHV